MVRKYEFDGIVIEIAVPNYFETFIILLGDAIHVLPGNKRLVVVIPPYISGYPSAEVCRAQGFRVKCRRYSIRMFMSTISVL